MWLIDPSRHCPSWKPLFNSKSIPEAGQEQTEPPHCDESSRPPSLDRPAHPASLRSRFRVEEQDLRDPRAERSDTLRRGDRQPADSDAERSGRRRSAEARERAAGASFAGSRAQLARSHLRTRNGLLDQSNCLARWAEIFQLAVAFEVQAVAWRSVDCVERNGGLGVGQHEVRRP